MKKTGYFFLCFLPMIISVSLQVILSFPMMGLSMMQTCISNLIAGKKTALDELVTQLYARWSSENFTMTLSIIFSICCILLFGFWYTYQFEGRLKQSPKNFLNVPVVLSLILIVPGLQLFSSILTGLSASVFPNWMKFYEKLMETAGFSQNPSILLFLYAVLLGPVGEELIFRGVTLSSAKRVFPFWAANIFQALLFGIFHLNVIQSIYAFMIGLVLGYVCERGGSICLSMFLHMLFNAWGTFVSTDNFIYSNPLYLSIFFVLAIFFALFGLYLFHKNAVSARVNDPSPSSDI